MSTLVGSSESVVCRSEEGCESSRAWLYKIPDAKDKVISISEGFPTQQAARTAGEAEAERLKLTGDIPAWARTDHDEQDSQEPWK